MLYLVSAGDIFLEKNKIGCQVPLMHCCKTAPATVSEASVIKQVGALAAGYESSEAFVKASFVAVNETIASSVQLIDFDLPLKRECRGCMRLAQ